MSRWKMNKLGFVNFWLYDAEEFPLHDGHILLRGTNATGKSITTQSFIPFILDGDKRPERLDPFGSRERKMDYYLLGNNDLEESTGYLYLEFRKPDAEEYRTIGVGMRAQRGKGIDFWGFCLNDGRRIGPDGLMLYDRVGDQLLPVGKRKLRGLIDSPDCWAESQTRYKEMVNRQIFGFEDIRQFDQLVNILIQVRAPKLSKDFRPSRIREILNDSLQVLTDDDLSAMVTTMEQMDSLEDTLHGYQTSMQASRTIRNEYNRYNQYILGKKGEAYLAALEKTRSADQKLRSAERQRSELEEERGRQETRERESGQRLEQARAKRASMGEDTLSAKRDQLQAELERCGVLERQLSESEDQIRRMEDGVAEREVRLSGLAADCDNAAARMRQFLRDLDDANGILLLDPEHGQYARALREERSGDFREAVLAALNQRGKQIRDVLECLKHAAEAREKYDSACELLDRAEETLRQKDILVRNAQDQEREERDRLLEDFTRWRDASTVLWFPQDVWLGIRRALAAYRDSADWSAIRNQADERTRVRESELTAEKFRAENTLKGLKDEQADLETQLKQIRERPDPVPPRRDQISATRFQLVMRGIPCAPFYELVDFAPGLSQEEKDLLEAQLMDAGILDALIVPEEHLPEIREFLEEYPDRFLLPGPAVRSPLTGIVPDGTGRFAGEVEACLRSISQADPDDETAILPDGSFRCGVIRGRSVAESPAGYVGAAAREENRQRQIRKLESQLESLSEKISAAQSEADWFNQNLAALKEERGRMPNAEDLDQALSMLSEANREYQLASQERDRQLAAERAAKQDLDTWEEKCRTGSAGLPYQRDIPSYEEADGAAEQYRHILYDLDSSRQKLESCRRAREELDGIIADQRDQIASRRRDSESTRTMLLSSRASADALQAFLDLPENQERTRRLAELEEEIRLQDQENREAHTACARLEEQIRGSEAQIRERKDQKTSAVLEEQDLEAYFREDLELGFSGLDETLSLEERAKRAADSIPAADRERSPEHMSDALQNNFQKQNNSLLQYHPELRLTFDASARPGQLRQRYCIYLKKGGRELSLYGFIQSLQDDIDSTGAILEERDRELFENILTETISHKLRNRIEESAQWTRSMTALMSTLTTSMGLTFSLDWKERKSESEGELDTASLVTLLNKDRALLTAEDSQKVSAHFRNKLKRAREEAHLNDLSVNYADLIRSVLDYRNWYEFILYYRHADGKKQELTDSAFNTFSGGEKAMAMYVPLFAAVSAQYRKASPSCPLLLALDEAFAGVDDQNVSAMFDLMAFLDFDYILNSQSLWCAYANVADLDIAELIHPAGTSVITVLRYHWNGNQRTVEDSADEQ